MIIIGGKKKDVILKEICRSIYEYFEDGKPVDIKITPGVKLKDSAQILRNIAEIMESASLMEDDVDSWKDSE